MYFLVICFLLPQNSISRVFHLETSADKDICNYYNGKAVHSENGDSYIFQSDSYWMANPLNEKPGITSSAKLVSDKWPEVDDQITGVFIAPGEQSHDLKTIFVVGKKWMAYEENKTVLEGTTHQWPGFAELDVTVMFNVKYGSPMVYVLYNDNNDYILYYLKTLAKPIQIRSGYTTVSKDDVLFLQDNYDITDDRKGPNLKGLIDVRGVLTYKDGVVFIGTKSYCIIDLVTKSNSKICTPKQPLSTLFGCPLLFGDRSVDSKNVINTISNHSTTTTTTMTSSSPIMATMDTKTNIAIPRAVVDTSGSKAVKSHRDPLFEFTSKGMIPVVIIAVVIGISCVVLIMTFIIAGMVRKRKRKTIYLKPNKPKKLKKRKK